MHTEKIKIFDEYAKNIDTKFIQMGAGDLQIEDWEDLLLAFRYSKLSLPDVKRIIFEACDLVQKAQQERIKKGIKHADTMQTILDVLNNNIEKANMAGSCGELCANQKNHLTDKFLKD